MYDRGNLLQITSVDHSTFEVQFQAEARCNQPLAKENNLNLQVESIVTIITIIIVVWNICNDFFVISGVWQLFPCSETLFFDKDLQLYYPYIRLTENDSFHFLRLSCCLWDLGLVFSRF